MNAAELLALSKLQNSGSRHYVRVLPLVRTLTVTVVSLPRTSGVPAMKTIEMPHDSGHTLILQLVDENGLPFTPSGAATYELRIREDNLADSAVVYSIDGVAYGDSGAEFAIDWTDITVRTYVLGVRIIDGSNTYFIEPVEFRVTANPGVP